MKLKLKCHWKSLDGYENKYTQWGLMSDSGGQHARAGFDQNTRSEKKPFVSWTYYTEGNDHFATLEEAKVHAEQRLQELLDDLADCAEEEDK